MTFWPHINPKGEKGCLSTWGANLQPLGLMLYYQNTIF
jgi:hypothetical protein